MMMRVYSIKVSCTLFGLFMVCCYG